MLILNYILSINFLLNPFLTAIYLIFYFEQVFETFVFTKRYTE